jgi:hypothetical protein
MVEFGHGSLYVLIDRYASALAITREPRSGAIVTAISA